MSVDGPIARSVRDVALMLSVIAGPDPRVPTAIAEPGSVFLGSLRREFKGVRIAWSRDLGRYPVEPAVSQVFDSVRRVFVDLGCIVDDGGPEGEVTIHIDDKELSLTEFGRMLTVHAGWGMRIAFLPEEFISENPKVEIRKPKRRKR